MDGNPPGVQEPRQTPLDPSMSDGLRESSQNITEEDGTGRRWKLSGHVARLMRIVDASLIIIIINLMALMTLFIGFRDLEGHVNSLYLAICAFLTFSGLLCGICLMFLTLNLLSNGHAGVLSGQYYRAPIFLLVISCGLLILTAASFSCLKPKLSIFLVALLPASLILVMIYYFIIQTEDDHSTTGYESYKAELKQCLSLSSTVTSLGFSGLIGTLVGYSKESSVQSLSQNMEVDVSLMFFISMFGLLLMLLSSAPPRIEDQSIRKRLTKVLKTLSCCLFSSLAPVAAIVASRFLEISLLLALSPALLLGVMVLFGMIQHHVQEWGRLPRINVTCRDHTAELKLISKVATTTTSITFAGMMSVFSGFLGSKASEFQLKICVLVMFFAFYTSFSAKLLLTFKAPKEGIVFTIIKILNACSLLLLALAAMVVYFLEVLGGGAITHAMV